MTIDYDAEIREMTRTLAEIAHTLESMDNADARVERVLRVMARCVPYQRCALLKSGPLAGSSQALVTVPEVEGADRDALVKTLEGILRLMGDAEEIGRSSGPTPNLALPVVGLDQVIGVLRIEPAAETRYHAKHLRLLSVIAAQLGAFLTTLWLRQNEATHARDLAAAHDFQQLMAGVVSHDLRNPMSVIMAAASSLLKAPASETQAKTLRRILASVRIADRIINDLMDVTRARAAGGLGVTRKPLELVALVREVVEDSRLAHPGRTIDLVVEETAIPGHWDAARVAQLLTNLLNNAFVHGDEKSPVSVKVERAGESVVLTIHNRGPTIPAELLPYVFDPFRRGGAGRRREKTGGLGLGLYIVSQIAWAHGGRVEVRSRAGETTFTVELPIRPTSSDERGAARSPLVTRDVLIIDDAAEARTILADLLTEKGFNVLQAENGEQGLERLRELGKPCIVLLDLTMPVMDGWEFHRELRADPQLRDSRVIIVSGTGTQDSLPQQVDAFLPKPVDLPKLEEILQGATAPEQPK